MPPYCWAPALLLAGVVPVILAEAVEAEKGSWVRLHPAQRLFGRWSSPPRLPPTPSFSDGPYAGNGDLGVTIGGPPERVVQYCALKSFWTGAFFESGSSHGLQRRWGMLLAASLVWDAPLLRGASYDATQELGTGRMNLTLGDGSFESSTFVGQADAGQGANFYATEFGVSAAARPLTLTLQIRPGNPDLRSKQDYNAGSTRGGTADGGVVWTARNNTNITGNASNHYTGDSFSFTHLTMGLAAKVTAADAGPAPVVTHAHDGTHNGTHSLAMVLQPGRRYVLTVWVACHEWGKGDPVTEAISNLARVGSNDGRATAWEAANTWWQRHWASTPVVRHFSEAAEQYYYGTLYTMASSKRAGTVGIDRQGPFMTQDNSIWPYICNNYNLQAPYFGMLAANMSWTMTPMMERVMQSVPLFQARAKKLLVNVVTPKHGEDHPPDSAYGSYAGIEMPGHIGAYDWMWDGSYEGQDAGQRFDAPFTAMMMVDYFDFTQNRTFLQSTCYPFLKLTVDFLQSYVRNDTGPHGEYSLHIHHGCAQEGCVGQPAFPNISAGESRWKQQDYGDSTPDLAFFKLALRSAIRLSKVLGTDAAKVPTWTAMLQHLPSYQTDTVPAEHISALEKRRPPAAPVEQGYSQSLGAIGKQGGEVIQIHCTSAANHSGFQAALVRCAQICKVHCDQQPGCLSFAVLHPHVANDGRSACQLYPINASSSNEWWTLWRKPGATPGSGHWPSPSPPPPRPRPSVPGTVFAISANFTGSKTHPQAGYRPFHTRGLISYAIVYTAAMYPATDVDIADNATWRAIAVRTLRNLPAVPYNGAQMIFNAAVRVGYPAEELVNLYQPLFVEGIVKWPSFKVDFGSSNGMENAGLIDALNDMLMQSWRGYIEFFPCWPANKSGSFVGLRARGAFSVSAAFDPAATPHVGGIGLTSDAGARCLFASPWDEVDPSEVVVRETRSGEHVEVQKSLEVRGAPVFGFETKVGGRYTIGISDAALTAIK